MIDRRGFLWHAVVYGMGGVAMQVASAVLLPLYTHYLTPADYGILEILERTGQVITLLLLERGIRIATFTFYCQAKSPSEQQRTYSSISVVLWTILALGAVGALALSPYLATWLGIERPSLVVLGIGVVLLEGVVTLPMALMQARVDSVGFVTVNLLMSVVRMTLIIVGVAAFGLGVWGVLGGSAICFGLFGVALTAREMTRGFSRPEPKIVLDVIRFSLPLLPAGLLGFLLHSADRFFLLTYASPTDIGTYSLGQKLAAVIPTLATAPLWKVWTARMYDLFEQRDASRVVGRVIVRMMAVCVFVELGVCLLRDEIVAVIAPRDYGPAATVIPLLAIAATLSLASNLCEGCFWAKRRTRWKPIIMGISALTAVVCYYVLVPQYGALGAAMAFAGALAVHASITFVITQRVFYVSYDWRAVFVGSAAAVALWMIGQLLGVGIAASMARCGLWMSWPLLLWCLNAFDSDEKAWLRRQAHRVWCLVKRLVPRRNVQG